MQLGAAMAEDMQTQALLQSHRVASMLNSCHRHVAQPPGGSEYGYSRYLVDIWGGPPKVYYIHTMLLLGPFWQWMKIGFGAEQGQNSRDAGHELRV